MEISTQVEGVILDRARGGEIDLDIGVRRVLPPHSRVTSFTTLRSALWSRAARIIVLLNDNTEKFYFLKIATGDSGRPKLEGEYASIKEIAKFKPELTVVPIALGQYEDSLLPTYFFLMEHLHLSSRLNANDLCEELAKLHATSVSPTGKFGFHIATYQGPFRQDNTWDDSWAKYFGRLLRLFLSYEMEANGPSTDGKYESEFQILLDTTVDRLLEPLQTDGRQLKPCLVHGNLWQENAATDLDTGKPKIFDAACFYAHNEFEFGMWRRPLIKFDLTDIELYFNRYCEPSQPEEQCEDRNRLYCVNFELCQSTAWKGSKESSRKTIMEHMVFLNQKYATSTSASVGERSDTAYEEQTEKSFSQLHYEVPAVLSD